jgi:CDP-diacylglycerol---glycerol-3-phosphate 3-phosphatidyltransferase
VTSTSARPKMEAVVPVSAWNVANGITVLRVALVPVFLSLLLLDGGNNLGWRLTAFGIFAVAMATDRLDGDLARRRGLVTNFGKIADPIADKALMGAALVGLSLLGELPWWVSVLILVREVGVTVLRLAVIRHEVIAASSGGKAKTVLQTVAVGLYLLPLSGWAATGRASVMAAAVALTLLTGLDYTLRAVKARRQANGSGLNHGETSGKAPLG